MYVVHIYPQHGGQSIWDSWVGNTSGTVPYFITEYGWQNGGSNPTSGTTSGYGVPFENYLDSKGISSTAWVFDTVWQPVMFDTSWNLLGGDGYMGQQTQTYLANHKNDNLPSAGGSTPTNTPVTPVTPTRTRTPTTGPSLTPTRTTPPGQATATRTPTTLPVTLTPTQPTGTCTTITAPFTKDGAGTLCWQIATIPSYINSWNTTSVTINGVNETNLYVATGSLPAKVNGLWTINYSASVSWAHFEAK
jgi:hypothetical protein